jgi:hypothetical protein
MDSVSGISEIFAESVVFNWFFNVLDRMGQCHWSAQKPSRLQRRINMVPRPLSGREYSCPRLRRRQCNPRRRSRRFLSLLPSPRTSALKGHVSFLASERAYPRWRLWRFDSSGMGHSPSPRPNPLHHESRANPQTWKKENAKNGYLDMDCESS